VKIINSVEEPLIYLITDGETTTESFPEKSAEILKLIKVAVESKINLIQIREKKLPARFVFELAEKAAKITRNTSTRLLINDRADIALAANADGVHLTSASLPAVIVRQIFPENFIIGVSAHRFEEAASAKENKTNFVTFSPIFRTPSKAKYGDPQGLEKLREICESLKPFPVIALGGIDETNYRTVLENGASGFAAIRFLNNAENLRKFYPGYK
jgi:thiamine-phosphate pyrophosphorylase